MPGIRLCLTVVKGTKDRLLSFPRKVLFTKHVLCREQGQEGSRGSGRQQREQRSLEGRRKEEGKEGTNHVDL